MGSEKSHKTGLFVRSKGAGKSSIRPRDPKGVHYVSTINPTPDTPHRTACLRAGRFVEVTSDKRISIMQEDNKNQKLMRITEYRTLTTCKVCTSGKVGNVQR